MSVTFFKAGGREGTITTEAATQIGWPDAIRSRKSTSLHRIGWSSIALVAPQGSLYHLDPAATLIAQALADGEPPLALAAMIADAARISQDQAQRHVAQIENLLWPAPAPGGASRDEGLLRWVSGEPPAAPPLGTRSYRLLDLTFDCVFADPQAQDLAAAAFAHLEVPLDGPAATRFLAGAQAGDVLVWRDRSRLDAPHRPEAMVNLLRLAFAETALASSMEGWAVHAGAVARGGRAVLLPGPAGTGKSTLTLGLGAAGWMVYGDDTVVLTAAALEVRPMPLPLCVKRGTWPIAEMLLGSAGRGVPGRRPDGVDVRWLPYGGALAMAAPTARTAVGHIVFPVFDPGSRTTLQPLDAEAALPRLVPGLHALGKGLAPERVEQLIAWAASRPWFELRYPSLAEAVAVVEGLAG